LTGEYIRLLFRYSRR